MFTWLLLISSYLDLFRRQSFSSWYLHTLHRRRNTCWQRGIWWLKLKFSWRMFFRRTNWGVLYLWRSSFFLFKMRRWNFNRKWGMRWFKQFEFWWMFRKMQDRVRIQMWARTFQMFDRLRGWKGFRGRNLWCRYINWMSTWLLRKRRRVLLWGRRTYRPFKVFKRIWSSCSRHCQYSLNSDKSISSSWQFAQRSVSSSPAVPTGPRTLHVDPLVNNSVVFSARGDSVQLACDAGSPDIH